MSAIQKLKRTAGVAGQVAFDVTAQLHSDTYDFGFVGTSYGEPGPVTLITASGLQVNVEDPARFGPVFDESWVRSFFAGWEQP